MNYQVTHATTYRYRDPVSLGHNQAHLVPRSCERQRCRRASVAVLPTPRIQRAWTDYFGNHVTFFSLEEEHRELSVVARSTVEVLPPRDATVATPAWEEVRRRLERPDDADSLAAAQFVFESTCVRRSPEAAEYAAVSFAPGRPLWDACLDLTARIFRDFRYDPSATSVHTTTAEVFRKRRGVCQDFAHLQLACLRSQRLAGRYVSGYLLTDPPPGQVKLVGADASHAWVAVYCPGHGWLDLDPTNNQVAGLRHVTLAWGRDYQDVCPLKGVFLGGGPHTLSVAVDVTPAPEPAPDA